MSERYKDEHWLREQYHEKGKSLEEIAEQTPYTRQTILRWMEKHNIQRRGKNEARANG